MRPWTRKISVAMAALITLSGCYGETEIVMPEPQELTRHAMGHYCGMIVADHSGPKAQIFMADNKKPVWFASVRDAFVFMLLPGEAKNMRAIYVNDMGKTSNWKKPDPKTWIEARKAYFVLGSTRKGGMGLKETVPFGTAEAAQAFAAQHGGHVVGFAKVPADYVLGDDTSHENSTHENGAHENSSQHDDHHGPEKKGGAS